MVSPIEILAEAQTPSGGTLRLVRQGPALSLWVDGQPSTTSRQHGTEDALGAFPGSRLRGKRAPRVFIGGLGLGFTLRAALDTLPSGASITVAERIPEVAEWHSGPVGELADHPLDDPRVTLVLDEVAMVLAQQSGTYDAVLLDLDVGVDEPDHPDSGTAVAGLTMVLQALRPGGMLVVWAPRADKAFSRSLAELGFEVETRPARAPDKKGRGPRDVLIVGTLPRPGSGRGRSRKSRSGRSR